MSKLKIYLIGLATLLLFPIPAYFMLRYTDNIQLADFFQLDKLHYVPILLGIELGLLYACIAIVLMNTGLLVKERAFQKKMLQQLNMNMGDMLFLSLCAGIGEELLFRIGVQHYLGPIYASLIFVALHGYFDPRNWRTTLYGILVTPFIFLIAFGLDYFGLWFCIAAHAAYDLLLFYVYGKQPKEDSY
ncbi:MAG: CPBP family intramembrane glutamic endopeptidase [Crocinitomicaceae bacterium]